MTPETWEQWAGAVLTVGGAIYAAWTKGAAISGWCRDRWTARRAAAAARAADQAAAEKAVRRLTEAIASKNEEIGILTARNADLMGDLIRKNEIIAAQDRRMTAMYDRMSALEARLDGSRP